MARIKIFEDINKYRARKAIAYAAEDRDKASKAVKLKKELEKMGKILVPILKPKTKNKLKLEDTIDRITKSDYFWKIWKAWGDIPGVSKTKINFSKVDTQFTKGFQTTALIIQSFIQGNIYKKGFTDIRSRFKIRPNLPDNFKELEIEYTVNGMKMYFERFNSILNDPEYQIKNRKFIEHMNLAKFIFGSITSFSAAKPILLTYCVNKPGKNWYGTDTHKIKLWKNYYRLYVSKIKKFNNYECLQIQKLMKKILNFAAINNNAASPSKFIEHFFISLNGWKEPSINFLYSNNMWDKYISHLIKKGFILKPESLLSTKKEIVEKPESPVARRKKLLKAKKEKEKEANKPINRKMNFFN